MTGNKSVGTESSQNRVQIALAIIAGIFGVITVLITVAGPIINDSLAATRNQSATETAVFRQSPTQTLVSNGLLPTQLPDGLQIAQTALPQVTIQQSSDVVRCWANYAQIEFKVYPIVAQTFSQFSTSLFPVPSMATNVIENPAILPRISPQQILNIIGSTTNETTRWLFVEVTAQGMASQQGYVPVEQTTFSGDFVGLPVITIPYC